MVFISKRTSIPIGVIEHNRHRSLGNSGLTLLIHELLKVSSTNLLQVRDTEDEANGIENVRFAGTVQPSDGVEEGVEARNDGSGRVGFEPFQANLLDVHGGVGIAREK